MVRTILTLAVCAVLLYVGLTVRLGSRTFFGHLSAIWSTPEAQDMRKGVGEKAGPALERVKRGVEAGIKAAADTDDGVPDAGPLEAPPASGTP